MRNFSAFSVPGDGDDWTFSGDEIPREIGFKIVVSLYFSSFFDLTEKSLEFPSTLECVCVEIGSMVPLLSWPGAVFPAPPSGKSQICLNE